MAVKVYPVTKTQEICEDYEVFINGQKGGFEYGARIGTTV